MQHGCPGKPIRVVLDHYLLTWQNLESFTTMTITTYSKQNSAGKTTFYYYNESYSNKVGNKVVMNETNHYFLRNSAVELRRAEPYDNWPLDANGQTYLQESDWAAIENTALARFEGKLRKGSASLGVTLAQWKQARDMIATRAGATARMLSLAEDRIKTSRSLRDRLKGRPNQLAGLVLEGEFGWVPLYKDIIATMTTVCGDDAIPPPSVKASHREVVARFQKRPPINTTLQSAFDLEGWQRVTLKARVQVTNPNLWLLNRLGLINLPGVLWDIVPWSFVVNMFSNVGAIVNSFTSEIGIDVTGKSTTRSAYLLRTQDIYRRGDTQDEIGKSKIVQKYKKRTVGSFPTRQLVLKTPELNWELAMIACALVVQKANNISKLIR